MKKKRTSVIPESTRLKFIQEQIDELEKKCNLRLLYIGWRQIGKLCSVSGRTMKRISKKYGWTFREINGKPAVSPNEVIRMFNRLPKRQF